MRERATQRAQRAAQAGAPHPLPQPTHSTHSRTSGAARVGSLLPIPAAIWDTYKGIIESANGATEYEEVERMAFYERSKRAFVIVSTGETAFYGVSAPPDLIAGGGGALALESHTLTHTLTHTHLLSMQNLILKKGIIGKAGE